jgi:flagellar motility protein MotE (MotC chaperone)
MENIEQEKSYSKLEWFFYIILLPFLFTIVLIGIILTAMKVDVLQTLYNIGNQIPYVEQIVPDAKSSTLADSSDKQMGREESLAEKLRKAETSLAEKDEVIKEKEAELAKKTADLEQLKQEIDSLQEKLKEKMITAEERKAKIEETARLFTAMSPSKAASIMEKLGFHEAVLLLSAMNEKDKSELLEKMSSDHAAQLTVLLKETEYSENLEIKALQERVQALVEQLDKVNPIISASKGLKGNNLDTNTTDLTNTVQSFELMEAKSAADIISKMWNEGKKEQVIAVLKVMNPTKRSNILTKMDSTLAAKITAEMLK